MYVVVRIDTSYSFGVCRKDAHIYSKQSNIKSKMVEYYEEIKAKYPDRKIILTTLEKATKAREQLKEYFEEKERVALGVGKRITVGELNRELNKSYTRQLAIESCGRR